MRLQDPEQLAHVGLTLYERKALMALMLCGVADAAAARTRILSYMEAGDLMAIDTAVKDGFPILRRIAKNAAEHGVEHRVVFGGRYSGELGHPFHVVDDEAVVLPLDHPFVKGRPIRLAARLGSRACGQSRGRLSGTLAEGDEESARDSGGSARPQDLSSFPSTRRPHS
jgi:hypothetical protein